MRWRTVILIALACLVAGCTTNSSGNANRPHSSTTGPTAEHGQLTDTQVPCDQFSQGTAETLEHLAYASEGAQIRGVIPFQFHYWIQVKPVAGVNRVVVDQSVQGPFRPLSIRPENNGVYSVEAGQCVGTSNSVAQDPHTGAVTLTFNESSKVPPTVYVEVSFSTTSLAGKPVPPAQEKVVFRFSMQDASSSVDLISD